jgi:hypothetical protein
MFMNEISVSDSKPSKDSKENTITKHVSFSELHSLFNMTFNLRDTDADAFLPL